MQLNEAVKRIHPHAREHLQRCGLNPAEVVWTQEPVGLLGAEQYVPCMFNRRLAPGNAFQQQYVDWANVIERYSSKEGLLAYANRAGFFGLLPPTLTIASALELPGAFPFGGPYWVKNAEGETTGGVNVLGPLARGELADAVSRFTGQGVKAQVQKHVDGKDISNQYLAVVNAVGEVELKFLGTTSQVVSGGHHVGNKWPATVGDCGWLTHGLAQALVSMGLQGFFGVDARISDLSGYVTEWNLRVNGSSVPLYLARKWGYTEAYLIRETPLNPALSARQVFHRLRVSGLEHRPGRGGAVAYLWGWAETAHTLGIATFGERAREMYDEVSELLIA